MSQRGQRASFKRSDTPNENALLQPAQSLRAAASGGRILSEFRCDPVLSRSLRHAFVSQLANANVSEEQRMELRHTTRDIHKL
jgi:hypothetical protein